MTQAARVKNFHILKTLKRRGPKFKISTCCSAVLFGYPVPWYAVCCFVGTTFGCNRFDLTLFHPYMFSSLLISINPNNSYTQEIFTFENVKCEFGGTSGCRFDTQSQAKNRRQQ